MNISFVLSEQNCWAIHSEVKKADNPEKLFVEEWHLSHVIGPTAE